MRTLGERLRRVDGARVAEAAAASRAWRWRKRAWHSSANVSVMGSASSPLAYSARAKPTMADLSKVLLPSAPNKLRVRVMVRGRVQVRIRDMVRAS